MGNAWRLGVKEFLLLLRHPAAIAVLVVSCLAALAACANGDIETPIAGYRLTSVVNVLLGFLLIPLMALTAQRDSLSRASDIVLTRPYPLDRLIILRCVGSVCASLVLLIGVALAGALGRLVLGDATGPLMAWHALARSFVGIIFLCTLSYCFTWLMRNHLAAAVVGAVWAIILVGRDYLGRILDFSLSQNAPIYLPMAVGLVLLTAAVARHREAVGRPLRALATSAAFVLALSLLLAYALELGRHDPPFRDHPVAVMMSLQHAPEAERAPGFWLPDQNGRIFRLSDTDGKPAVIALWSPLVAESGAVLPFLAEIHRRWGDRVTCVAICLANDVAYGRHAAREMRAPFAMLVDPGSHVADTMTIKEAAPLATAYDVSVLPSLFITNDRRQIVQATALNPNPRLRLAGSTTEQTLARVLGESPAAKEAARR